jgi:hypothetical protein
VNRSADAPARGRADISPAIRSIRISEFSHEKSMIGVIPGSPPQTRGAARRDRHGARLLQIVPVLPSWPSGRHTQMEQ